MPSRHREIIEAIERAQDQTETLEAREAALEELREKGVLDEVGRLEDVDEPEVLDESDVEAELEQLKRELDE